MNGQLLKDEGQMAKKQNQKCSTSLVITEMQIKTMQSPFYPELLLQRKQQMLAGKEAENKEYLCTVNENVIWLASITTKNQKQERIC